MSDEHREHRHHHHADMGPHLPHYQELPYWKRAHKDWKFWAGVIFIFTALLIYVTTVDLSTVPR